MNAIGLSLIMKMGCICSKESLDINGTRYRVIERLGEGYVLDISMQTYCPCFHHIKHPNCVLVALAQ